VFMSPLLIISALQTSRVEMRRFAIIPVVVLGMTCGCSQAQRENTLLSQQQRDWAINELRNAYAAFNRGDIDAAVRLLDPSVEWIEPAEFPGDGANHGVEGAKRYLMQSRASAAEVISKPEKFIFAGNRIVVFVHARVLPKNSNAWQEIRLADVYTFENGRVTHMHAFANRAEALRWVGLPPERLDANGATSHVP
jgi:uncharacterized protein